MGCTDPSAGNYDPSATIDDGSCMFTPQPIAGCTDPSANNYNPGANFDDGSCDYSYQGCTDPTATNYDPNASIPCDGVGGGGTGTINPGNTTAVNRNFSGGLFMDSDY